MSTPTIEHFMAQRQEVQEYTKMKIRKLIQPLFIRKLNQYYNKIIDYQFDKVIRVKTDPYILYSYYNEKITELVNNRVIPEEYSSCLKLITDDIIRNNAKKFWTSSDDENTPSVYKYYIVPGELKYPTFNEVFLELLDEITNHQIKFVFDIQRIDDYPNDEYSYIYHMYAKYAIYVDDNNGHILDIFCFVNPLYIHHINTTQITTKRIIGKIRYYDFDGDYVYDFDK